MLTEDQKQKIKNLNILVIGDIMLDRYIIGNTHRISPEAPVPVVNVTHEKSVLGGAANVANNLASIGVNVSLCGLLGADDYRRVISMLNNAGIQHKGVITDKSRQTTIKTRVMVGNQQIVRYDTEDTYEYEGEELPNYVSSLYNIDAVIISDYGKGVITNNMMWITYISCGEAPIIIDPNVNNYAYYEGRAHTITPNTNEALSFYNDDNPDKVGFEMLKRLNCKNVIITKGPKGLCVYDNGGSRHIEALDVKQVFDVSGAGDTLTSVYAVGIALGMSVYESAVMANDAAGEVVGDVGTSVIGERLWKK